MKNLHLVYIALACGLQGCESLFLFKLFNKEKCYSARGYDLGCFDNKKPFNDLPLPYKPDIIDPQFYLFTRGRKEKTNVPQMDLDQEIPPEFNPAMKTKIIIHGFLHSWDEQWMHDMKEQLLIEGNHNVILVDWSGGSQFSLIKYRDAASNIRVVAAYLGTLLNKISSETGYDMSKVHCIGHSLGAQTCAFTGKTVKSPLGRITGLDPAGPSFKDKDVEGRLDASDAIFVDSIHSNGRDSFTMNLGIGHQVADVDFIPNGGGLQPGCLNRRKRAWNLAQRIFPGYQTGPSCSHGRAYQYFTESINSPCQFIAVPCTEFEVDSHADCESCEGDKCQVMGYHADTRPGRGIFYVKTNSEAPYCINT